LNNILSIVSVNKNNLIGLLNTLNSIRDNAIGDNINHLIVDYLK
jgi:hypothetical protein